MTAVLDHFPRLLALSREAHAAGRHEVGYHSLWAALHSAEDDANEPGVRAVERLACDQLAWIDAHSSGSFRSAERLRDAELARRRPRGSQCQSTTYSALPLPGERLPAAFERALTRAHTTD